MPDHLTRDHPIPARARVISGLRQAADYLDQHSDVPVGEHGWTLLSTPLNTGLFLVVPASRVRSWRRS
jgi:hypothetical protein